MPRNRMIKPEYWDDEKLATISRDARLTYIAMWNFADDYGIVKGHYNWLKNTIYPYDCGLKIDEFVGWLKELQELGRIIPYKANNERYYYMPKFLEHQVINRPSKQRHPLPPKDILKDSCGTHMILIDEKKIKENKRKRKSVCIEYPEWLDMGLWSEFKKYRKEIRSPLTEHAEKVNITELKKLIDEGCNQEDIINQTIARGWKGFFPVKKQFVKERHYQNDGPTPAVKY